MTRFRYLSDTGPGTWATLEVHRLTVTTSHREGAPPNRRYVAGLSGRGRPMLNLNAEPDWWSYSEDHRQKRTLVDIVAEDDIGGTYVSLNGGGSRTPDNAGHDVLLRFRPRMAPAACSTE